MNNKAFKSFWQNNFPEALPINHELKWVYESRWFRIHSLPKSKRYAETEKEYQILLDRQNQIMTDLFGADSEILLIISLFSDDLMNDNYSKIKNFDLFEKVDTIELHQLKSEEYDENSLLDILIKKAHWHSTQQNDILKAIANDEIRMLFVDLKNKRIIAPYDGGVDLILESTAMKDFYKNKYAAWLSDREDGL